MSTALLFVAFAVAVIAAAEAIDDVRRRRDARNRNQARPWRWTR